MTAAVATTVPSRLPRPARLRLGAEIAWATARVRRLVRRNNLPTALARCRDDAATSRAADSHHEVVRVGRAVRRTLAVLPGQSRSLVSSLVLIAVLARRGITASLVIGVRPGNGSAAHAWVEVDGAPALPAAKGKFARLFVL